MRNERTLRGCALVKSAPPQPDPAPHTPAPRPRGSTPAPSAHFTIPKKPTYAPTERQLARVDVDFRNDPAKEVDEFRYDIQPYLGLKIGMQRLSHSDARRTGDTVVAYVPGWGDGTHGHVSTYGTGTTSQRTELYRGGALGAGSDGYSLEGDVPAARGDYRLVTTTERTEAAFLGGGRARSPPRPFRALAPRSPGRDSPLIQGSGSLPGLDRTRNPS
ncbi:hypothetical protein [Streptomyces sp. NPDC017991]|uniref:hypothetical protein n=1 Tax=Streptomyces sp. NPDC017991 TaxID=3365026 RepID=UPI00378EBD33